MATLALDASADVRGNEIFNTTSSEPVDDMTSSSVVETDANVDTDAVSSSSSALGAECTADSYVVHSFRRRCGMSALTSLVSKTSSHVSKTTKNRS
jgi:hypothetical protein